MDHKTQRDKQALETKKKIVLSCVGLLKEKEWQEIRISDICSRAQISVGAFYHHFKNKEDIFNSIDEHLDHYFYDHILQDCLKLPPEQGLLEYLCSQTGSYAQIGREIFSHMYKALLDNTHFPGGMSSRYFIKGIHTLLQHAQEEHFLPASMNVEAQTGQLLSINYGIYYFWCIMGDQIDVDQYCRDIFSKYLSALFHP